MTGRKWNLPVRTTSFCTSIFLGIGALALPVTYSLLQGPWPKGRVSPSEVDVLSFHADPTGRKDSIPAFEKARDVLRQSGGQIVIPCGRYKLQSTFVISRSHVILHGRGIGCVELVGVAGMGPVIQEGDSTANGGDYTFENGIEDLSVTRIGDPQPGDTGIFWNGFNYGWERNTLSHNHFIARAYDSLYTGDISIGMDAEMIYAYDTVHAYSYANRTADVRVIQAEFGRNKREHISPECGVEFTGPSNNINYVSTWMINRAAKDVGSMACFTNIQGSGIYRFTNSYAENWQFGFRASGNTRLLKELTFEGGHLSVSSDIFSPSDRLVLQGFRFSAVTSGGMTLPKTTYSSVHDSVIGGNFKVLAGLAGDADLALTGNTFAGKVTLSGVWRAMSFVGNILPQSRTIEDLSSGAKQIVGNTGSDVAIPDSRSVR